MSDVPEEVLDVEAAPPPRDADLTEVSALARQLAEMEEDVARKTRALRDALDAYRDLAERRLPERMQALGLKTYELTSGDVVKTGTSYVGSKLTSPEGIAWVRAHGGEELVRTTITVELPVGEAQAAAEILERVRSHPAANRFLKCALESSVHHSTIGAFARELAENQKNPPLDLLGVVRRTLARVGSRKRKPVEFKSFELEN